MADERKAAPMRGMRTRLYAANLRFAEYKWIGRVAVGALLFGVIGLGVWFGLRQPRFWQPLLPARPTASVEQRATVAATAELVALPTPSPITTPDAQYVRSGTSEFTSRELVTTTLAVPLIDATRSPSGMKDEWSHGAAQSVALSADGRWVAFSAQSTGGYDDLFLYDRSIDATQGCVACEDALTRVTVATDGAPSNGWVGAPAMVPDGRYLAFYAWASNLVTGDTNAVQDLFFYDRTIDTISRISVGANGGQANDRSGDSGGDTAPALSADGRYVAFHSAASNLTRGDSNGRVDVFLVDRQTLTTTLISRGADGVAGNGDSSHPALSVDGRYVLFASRATNLDPSVPALQAPGATQIYLHDRNDGSTTLISRGPDGRPGDGESSAPSISGDGRYLVYASSATNLVAGDSNQVADIFLHDRATGETRRVSVSSTGIQANRAAWLPQITLDGRHIVFAAAASNLVYGDGNNVADLFVYDQQARHTGRISVGVSGTWTGQEANGPSEGKAAIIPGGRLVAFVSQATNLVALDNATQACFAVGSHVPALPTAKVACDTNGVPGLYLHERVDAPTFTLSGQVVESEGQPVADVVVAAGPHRTTTDASGNFRFSTVVGGTYTLAVAKAGYSFSPPRRTVSLLRDLGAQDFLAFAGSDPTAFLDLPLFYDGSAATLLALLRDTDEGGLIDAWFDHDAPNYSQNGSMVLWDGRERTQSPYNTTLGCFERRCYEGHDGVDFPYRDPDPSTPNIFEAVLVRPAAAGIVAALVRNCDSGDRWCNGGYGNEVILWHDIDTLQISDLQHINGYFTRYSHLATVAVEEGQRLTPDLVIGEMGSTGNSFGTHLHFAVHVDKCHTSMCGVDDKCHTGVCGVDNGNSAWDGDKVDLPVDPFGWAGLEADPWATLATGTVSRWLWRFNPTTEAILLGSEGATLRDGVGNVTVRIPAGALAGQVRVELVTGAASAPPAGSQRTLGRGFRLQVLDWLQGGSAPNAAPARPVEVSVGFAGAAPITNSMRHLDIEELLLYHWQAGVGWSPLPTVVDSEAQAVIAASNQFGEFDLQAPLLCPADALEPDDSFDAAIVATGATATWDRLFDVAEDEDWFQVEATAGTSYQVVVDAVAEGVAITTELYDRDGLTRLSARRGPGTWSWIAAEAGSYFVRVAPEAGSGVGCEASYRLTISPQ